VDDDVGDAPLGEVSQHLLEPRTVGRRPCLAWVDVDVNDLQVVLAGITLAGLALVWNRQAEFTAAHPGLLLSTHTGVNRCATTAALVRFCRRSEQRF